MSKTKEPVPPLPVRSNAGLGSNVVPIRPTVGMSKLEQLRAFVAWEQEDNPEKTHIAAWALFEIERLRAAIQQTLDENGHLADGDNCTLIALKLALDVPNVELTGSALLRSPG